MIRILSQSPELTDSLQELILQPQSDIEAVRHYIYDHGFYINAEHMVRDEGKYYQMFRAVPARGPVPDRFRCTEKAHFMYGRILTEKRDPVLMEYLRGKLASNNKIARELARQDTPRCRARLAQLEEEDHIICSLLDAGTAK